jgi:hypothetical protein
MSITASNPAIDGPGKVGWVLSGTRDAVCRPAQPVMAGSVKPATPPSIVLREIIQASVDETRPKRKS